MDMSNNNQVLRNIFTDDVSYTNIVSNHIQIFAGTVNTLTTNTITGSRSIYTDGSYTNIDISNNVYALASTINTLTTTNVSGTRAVCADNSYSNVDISENVYARTGTIATVYTGTIYGSRSVFVDSSFSNTDISANITAQTGYISSLSTTTLAGNRSVFIDASFSKIDISKNITGSLCNIIDGSFTNITISNLKLATGTDGYALTCDTSGLLSLTQLTPTLLGLGNVENTSDASKIVSDAQTTELALKADLSGASFTGPIYTNSNINLTGSGILKYPSGTEGHVLISDSAGLLSLGTVSIGYPTIKPDNRYSGISTGSTWTESDNNKVKSVCYIDLDTGTYLVNYKIGVFSKNFGLQITHFSSVISTSLDLSAGDIPGTSYSHNYGIGVGLTLSQNFLHTFPISSSIITNDTNKRYYVNVQITSNGPQLIAIPFPDYTVNTGNQSHLYAIKIG